MGGQLGTAQRPYRWSQRRLSAGWLSTFVGLGGQSTASQLCRRPTLRPSPGVFEAVYPVTQWISMVLRAGRSL